MTPRRLLTLFGILLWSVVALTAWPHGKSRRSAKFVLSASGDEQANRCSDLHVTFSHREAVVGAEERTITKAEAPTLRVTAESNGGVQVNGWDNDSYLVTLCKAADEGDDAQSILSEIHLTFHDGELGVSGPGSQNRWSAHLLIRSPKTATLDLSLKNGPVSLHHVDGQLKVRSQNGPVTVSSCSGQLDLSSQNGPLTLENNSGKQTVHAQNGPVTVALSGDSWNGDGLEAHATNGPITLRIPSGYRTGVILESEGHSPFECNSSVCSEGRRTWDEDHKRIEFGSGPTLVRVSTVNGPVSVN